MPPPKANTAATAAASDRNRALAIHHATLLQNRKDTESTILDALERLIDFPSSPATADAARPSPSDLAAFRAYIRPFQVSDYDALLEERNAARSCAYVFCPRPYASESRGAGAFRILWGSRTQDLRIVPRSEVRRWCSLECARRAMYIKVQLSEVPAWERAGGLSNDVFVLPEDDEDMLSSKIKGMTLAGRTEEEALRDAMAELAVERGDSATKPSARAAAFADVAVTEKQNIVPAQPPETPQSPDDDSKAHLEIEGYAPRTKSDSTGEAAIAHDSDWTLP